MILLLGASGYIGSAFRKELAIRDYEWMVPPCTYETYTTFSWLLRALSMHQYQAVINCAAYIPGVVDNCEDHKAETFNGNLIFPIALANACEATGTPLIHVSTGCLYNGNNNGEGFRETDTPHLSFRTQCGTYVGAKELAEEWIGRYAMSYICRLRLPFCHESNPRNYITKLLTYPKVYDNFNSLTCRWEFAGACLDLFENEAVYGTYHLTNPGGISARAVVEMLKKSIAKDREFTWWDEDEFMRVAARTPKSNCLLNTDKARAAGVNMRNVVDAVDLCIRSWKE